MARLSFSVQGMTVTQQGKQYHLPMWKTQQQLYEAVPGTAASPSRSAQAGASTRPAKALSSCTPIVLLVPEAIKGNTTIVPSKTFFHLVM
jgi:hypothetical protein